MADELENRVEKVEDRLDRMERVLDRATTLTLMVAEQRAEDEKAWKARREEDEKAWKLKHAELEEAITVLVHTVDDWIRNNPRNGGSGSVQKS